MATDGEQYPLLSLRRTGAALSVCTQPVLLLPNIRIAIDEDASPPISPRKEYYDPPNRPAIQRSTFQFGATPPSSVQVHKTVRRRNLQSDHRSLAITGEPPSTGAGLDYDQYWVGIRPKFRGNGRNGRDRLNRSLDVFFL